MIFSEEKCWEIISKKFNRYFRAKYLIDFLIAEEHGITSQDVNNCRKMIENPYKQEENSIRGYIGKHLAKLERERKIEKHSYYVWKIIS